MVTLGNITRSLIARGVEVQVTPGMVAFLDREGGGRAYCVPGDRLTEKFVEWAARDFESQLEEQEARNARRIKEWGVPGSKAKQRITKKAEAKAAEERELFMAAAGALKESIERSEGSVATSAQWNLKVKLNQRARRHGFGDWLAAYEHLRESEDETK